MSTYAANAFNYIGIGLSGATLRAVLVTGEGTIHSRYDAPLDLVSVPQQVASVARELQGTSSIGSIGIAVPGLVNPRTKRIEVSSDFAPLTERDLHEEIQKQTNLPVTLFNDANAAGYAEYTVGAGRGSRSMFYALIGKGIGGALILDGKLWLGSTGFAGEFGYLAIDAEGAVLEDVASAPNIVRRTHERLHRDGTSSLSRLALSKDFTAADIAREAKQGDDFALLMIERTGRYIGTAIASVINLLNIERVVLGGGVVAEAGDLILNPIIREAGRRSFQPCFEAAQITIAALGADAVSLGAALLARDAAQQNTQTA